MPTGSDSATAATQLDSCALLRCAVSVIVGTRDASNRPHVVRALGYRVHPSGIPARGLTIFLDQLGAANVIADVRDNGHVAVVFSQPSTHKSVQFKSAAARIEPQRAGDADLVRTYIEHVVEEICSLGYPRDLIPVMFTHHPEHLINLSFVPDKAFEQTPGAQAGQPLHG